MSKVSGTALVGGIVAVFMTVILAVTAITIAQPAADIMQLATILLGFAGTTVTALVTLVKVQDVDKKVEYLANGGMDAKVRAGLADVVKPALLRDDVEQQLEQDRAHRAAGPNGT